MKAKFVGDPRDPGAQVPDFQESFGTTFPAGKFVDVPESAEAKIAGNSHYEVQGAKKPDPEAAEAESSAEFAARVNAIDDREGLEAMLKAEKRPAAKAALEQRIAALPAA